MPILADTYDVLILSCIPTLLFRLLPPGMFTFVCQYIQSQHIEAGTFSSHALSSFTVTCQDVLSGERFVMSLTLTNLDLFSLRNTPGCNRTILMTVKLLFFLFRMTLLPLYHSRCHQIRRQLSLHQPHHLFIFNVTNV